MGAQDSAGSRIGPRLANLMAQGYATAKAQSLDTDHKARVASAWTVITQSGNEAAGFTGLISKALLAHPELPSDIRNWVEDNMSGRNQVQALLSGIGYQAIGGSGLSTVFANYLGPYAKLLMRAHPSIDLPYGTLAELAARGLYNENEAAFDAAGQGIPGGPFAQLVEGSRNWPSVDYLWAMLDRQWVSEDDAVTFLERGGVRRDLAYLILQLRHLLPTPEQAATWTAKGIVSEHDGAEAAAGSGVSGDNFAHALEEAYGRLPLGDVITLWRRGVIDRGTRDAMARRLGLAPDDVAHLDEVSVIPPSPPEALNALLEGQIDEATARRRWAEGGGDPSWFTDAFNTNGQPPTPVELLEMANRGVIPWDGAGPKVVSYHQGFLEGPWRNKWEKPFRALAEYLPPPRTVTALYHSGAITKAEAVDLLKKQGLSDALAHAYTVEAAASKTAKARELTVTQIETSYEEKAITHAQAEGALKKLGYDSSDAALLLAAADMKRASGERSRAITVARHAYLTGITDKQGATNALAAIGVDMAQAQYLADTWEIEKPLSRKRLTEAQVVKAHKHGVFDDAQAAEYLLSLGYSEEDAATLLTIG